MMDMMSPISARPSPPLRHRLDASTSSSSSSTSPSASDQEADQTIDDVNDSDSSSEDEAGIFFGQHTDAESRFLAKLSGSSTPSPSTPKCKRRQSRLVSRLRRDSTEFHRRKTMVFPIHGRSEDEEDQENNEEEKDEPRMSDRKMKERYQQEVLVSQISSSALAFDRSPLPGSMASPARMSYAFLGMCRASSPSMKQQPQSSGSSDTSSESDELSESGRSGSDKENVGMTHETACEVDDGLARSFDHSISLGARDQDIDFALADSLALDVGGMKLSDFADPEIENNETVLEESITYESSDSEVGDPLDSPTIHLAPLPLDSGLPTPVSALMDMLHAHPVSAHHVAQADTAPEKAEEAEDESHAGHEETGFEVLADATDELAVAVALVSPAAAAEEQPPSVTEDRDLSAHPQAVLAEKDVNIEPGPSELPTHIATADENVGTDAEGVDEDDDSEMGDLPVSRAAPAALPYSPLGPMLISESPFRSPITRPESAGMASRPISEGIESRLAEEMTSPTPTAPISPSMAPSFTPVRKPLQLGPLPTTWTPSQARGDLAPPAERTNKVLKPRIPLASSAKKPEPLPYKEKSKTVAIRGKLDSIFASKVGSMGPPQRTVSGSSLASSSSSSSGAGIGNRPASRTGMQASKLDAKASTSKFGSSVARPASSQGMRPMSTTVSRPTLSGSTFGRPTLSSASASKPAIVRPTLGASSAPTRPALAPRSLITHPAQQAHVKTAESKLSRPAAVDPPRPLAIKRPESVANAGPSASVQINPLKRPLSHSSLHSTMARQPVSTGPSAPRPALGLPSRLVRDAHQLRGGPVFQVGLGSVDMSSSRQVHRSPLRQPAQRGMGTPLAQKTAKLGTPSRLDGTPRSARGKPTFQMMSQAAQRPVHDVSDVSPSKSAGPPASATRQAEQALNVTGSSQGDDAQRGSSADYEDVSMMLPQPPSSSPPFQQQATPPESSASRDDETPKTRTKTVEEEEDASKDTAKGRRPKRAAKPPPSRIRTPAPAAAPYMSGKELKTATERNTSRNQVFFCAIDRQIVRVPGPRPPSPTSKIRTTADRDEEEKKNSREHRAKRRARDSGASTEAGSPERPVIQRVERARGPGDDEDWKTPARPAKKAKLREEKNVKWDKGLVIIHDDGSAVAPPSASEVNAPRKGCVRQAAVVELDKDGNIVEASRPKLDLKRSKITVTAVFYEGEEPVPEAPPVSTSSSGSKKKK